MWSLSFFPGKTYWWRCRVYCTWFWPVWFGGSNHTKGDFELWSWWGRRKGLQLWIFIPCKAKLCLNIPVRRPVLIPAQWLGGWGGMSGRFGLLWVCHRRCPRKPAGARRMLCSRRGGERCYPPAGDLAVRKPAKGARAANEMLWPPTFSINIQLAWYAQKESGSEQEEGFESIILGIFLAKPRRKSALPALFEDCLAGFWSWSCLQSCFGSGSITLPFRRWVHVAKI